jgi:hypothetical protein
MRKALVLSTALTLGVLSPGHAGGPVVVVEEDEVVAERPPSSAGVLVPLLLLAAVVAIAVSGDGDDDEVAVSDRRLKHGVERVGTNPLGLGVYRWRYAGLDGVWEGVMADEVEVLHPGAIRPLPMGYKAVDYGRLGLELKRVA